MKIFGMNIPPFIKLGIQITPEMTKPREKYTTVGNSQVGDRFWVYSIIVCKNRLYLGTNSYANDPNERWLDTGYMIRREEDGFHLERGSSPIDPTNTVSHYWDWLLPIVGVDKGAYGDNG